MEPFLKYTSKGNGPHFPWTVISRSYLTNLLLLPNDNPRICVNFWSGVNLIQHLPPIRAIYSVTRRDVRFAITWSQTIILFLSLPLRVVHLDQVPSTVILVTLSVLSHVYSAPPSSTSVKLANHFAYDSTKALSIWLKRTGFPVAASSSLTIV